MQTETGTKRHAGRDNQRKAETVNDRDRQTHKEKRRQRQADTDISRDRDTGSHGGRQS